MDIEKIQKLRKISGQSIIDCKQALIDSNNFDEAFDLLIERASEKIDKRNKDKISSEGRIYISDGTEITPIALVSLLCETDFTANNQLFINSLKSITIDTIMDNNENIKRTLKKLKGSFGENIKIGDQYIIENKCGYYIHFDNKKAAIIEYTSDKYIEDIRSTMNDIAMHIVAYNPYYLKECDEFYKNNPVDIPDNLKNKPKELINKIKDGKLMKKKKEQILLYQNFCKNETLTIKDLIESLNKKYNENIELISFKYINIGI